MTAVETPRLLLRRLIPDDDASRRVLKKCGMREIGPFTWRDLKLIRYEARRPRPPTAQAGG